MMGRLFEWFTPVFLEVNVSTEDSIGFTSSPPYLEISFVSM